MPNLSFQPENLQPENTAPEIHDNLHSADYRISANSTFPDSDAQIVDASDNCNVEPASASNADNLDRSTGTTKSAASNKRNKHDWLKIENEYIVTTQSQRDLAEKYDIDPAVIGRYASENHWKEKRQQFASETSARVVEMVAQARAEDSIAGIDVCDAIIAKFMREMASGKAKITAFDAMAAVRFREVLRGGVDSRSEQVHKDWRDFAKDAGLDEDEINAEFERIANERARQIDARGCAVTSRTEKERGTGWTD